MKKKIEYYVIGGQYEWYCYGGTPTLIGAKRLANRNEEYWDNWQGWHRPQIYRAEDTKLVPCRDRFLAQVGAKIRVPCEWAEPVEW